MRRLDRREIRLCVAAAAGGSLVTLLAVVLVWPHDADRGAPVVAYSGPSTEGPTFALPSSPADTTSPQPAEPSPSVTGESNGPQECEDDCEPADAPPIAGAPPAGEGPLPDSDPVSCPAATVRVADAGALQAALDAAKPGETIELADGRYAGQFTIDTSGTPQDPIFLCGGRDAQLDGGDVEDGYVLHLAEADHWRLVGFTVTNGQKGVMADGTTGTVIQDLVVTHIGDEAIHLRNDSTDNVVLDNTIRDTGLRRDDFGEGVYIGTAVSNWCSYTNCQPDRSDRNVVKGNDIAEVTGEPVDIKEGTTGGAIIGNVFDGSHLTGADSWVDVKGNNYLVAGNSGRNAPEDGFQTHQILDGWGDFNVFRANRAVVNGPGQGISSWPPESNVVACDNEVSAAGEGLSNIDCS
jgi:hypothetical protein